MKRKEMRKGNGECLPSSLEKVERVCTEIGGTQGGDWQFGWCSINSPAQYKQHCPQFHSTGIYSPAHPNFASWFCTHHVYWPLLFLILWLPQALHQEAQWHQLLFMEVQHVQCPWLQNAWRLHQGAHPCPQKTAWLQGLMQAGDHLHPPSLAARTRISLLMT